MNKKHFNNLFDSIEVTFLTLFFIASYLLVLIFGGIKNENTNHLAVYICSSAVFIPCIIGCLIIIFLGCFETWRINNGCVYSKKLFRKTVQINYDDITSVTEEVVPAIILGVYKTDAIVIKSSNKKIIIYLTKKITAEYIKRSLNIND